MANDPADYTVNDRHSLLNIESSVDTHKHINSTIRQSDDQTSTDTQGCTSR